ncbi:MAG: SagB/ThcOx family dehydrogenase [Myxococcales bacterium]|nr:SagB/ThcOx family dehydrogenase [Myxococcales bacterium]
MKTQWNSEVDDDLRPDPPERLCTLYHENSKLSPELARRQAAGLAMNRFEQYIASRGFHQHPHLPQVALPEAAAGDARLADVLRSRRSRRELSGALSLAELSAILQQGLGPTLVFETEEGVTQAYRAWPSAGGLYPIDAYVVAQAVDGLEPGVYHYNISTVALERLPPRGERGPAQVLRDGFFWQEWVTTAAAAILLVASFERTLAKYGERGYRLVLLDAGHAAQNALLVAEQAAVSACAVAGFCDDAVAEDLHLDGVDEAPVHAIILGKPPA